MQRRTPPHWIAAIGAKLVWTVLSTPAAWALIKGEAATLEFQVRNSDVIAQGTCEDSATTWCNKHFVTTYKIAVKKYFKAPAKMTVETHPVLFVSQVGGRVSQPIPLEESSPEMAAIFRGEEVVLFLQSPERVPAAVRAKYQKYVDEKIMTPSPLMTNYQLTTLNISKLSVIKDPRTGAPYVTRVNYDRLAMLPSAEFQQKYIQALQAANPSMTVKRGEKLIQIPVGPGLPVRESPPPGTMEEKIRQMQNYASPLDSFQRQIESIMNDTNTAAPAPVGGAQSVQPTRTIQPRKVQ